MKLIQPTVLFLSLLAAQPAFSQCSQTAPDLFGNYSVRCNDGNQYQVQKNELFGTTTMQGYNPSTGNRWSQEYRENGILAPTMSGTDARGNRYNCTMNSFTNQWQCN